MKIRKAEEILIDIANEASYAHGECEACPFYNILDYPYECPFAECPELWEI